MVFPMVVLWFSYGFLIETSIFQVDEEARPTFADLAEHFEQVIRLEAGGVESGGGGVVPGTLGGRFLWVKQ